MSEISDADVQKLENGMRAHEADRVEESPTEPPVCGSCGRQRTLEDHTDYNPLQVIAGASLGWYSGDDGEICSDCMTQMVRGGGR